MNLCPSHVFFFTYLLIYIVSCILFCYLINGSIFEILNQLFKGSLTIIILYLLSIIVLILAFFFRTFDEIFDLYYKLVNNIFKLMVIFTFIFVFVYLIFEPSSETFNFILLYLRKLRPILTIFLIIFACFTNKDNLFKIILTLSLGMLFFLIFSLLSMLFFAFFALFGSILISPVYSGNIGSVNLDPAQYPQRSWGYEGLAGQLRCRKYFEEILTEIEYQKKSLKDLNLNSDSFKFNSYATKRYNLVDFFSNFKFLDIIMNSSKYKFFPSCFQDYTLKSDYNKYSKEVLPKNIPLPTEEEVLLMKPDSSSGYIYVLTTVPCVEGHLNEVIESERLILKLMGIPKLTDVIKYHELYKQSDIMSLYIQGSGGSDSLYKTFKTLNARPTSFKSTGDYIKYAVYLKNSNGSVGELIGEVAS